VSSVEDCVYKISLWRYHYAAVLQAVLRVLSARLSVCPFVWTVRDSKSVADTEG